MSWRIHVVTARYYAEISLRHDTIDNPDLKHYMHDGSEEISERNVTWRKESSDIRVENNWYMSEKKKGFVSDARENTSDDMKEWTNKIWMICCLDSVILKEMIWLLVHERILRGF